MNSIEELYKLFGVKQPSQLLVTSTALLMSVAALVALISMLFYVQLTSK